jgi:hypothetical protein
LEAISKSSQSIADWSSRLDKISKSFYFSSFNSFFSVSSSLLNIFCFFLYIQSSCYSFFLFLSLYSTCNVSLSLFKCLCFFFSTNFLCFFLSI